MPQCPFEGSCQDLPIGTVGAWLAEPVAWGSGRARRMAPGRLTSWLVGRYASSLDVGSSSDRQATTPIEVFLRVGPRDLAIAPLALASLREHLRNAVSRVVVATPRAHVREMAATMADTLVVADEELISASLQRAIESAVLPSRTSWVLQQFLSLIHVSIAARHPCLVWDADTLLLRPQTVLRGEVTVLDLSTEHHEPYFTLIHSLLPRLPLPACGSLVAHHMVMVPELVRELFGEIEQQCGQPWWSAILRRVDPTEVSCMAEYELYGQWVRTRHPDRVQLAPFRNVALSRRGHQEVVTREWVDRQQVDSISLHWWLSETSA